MVCLGRPYHFKFFKGCLPQILFDPFLNTLSHITFTIRHFWEEKETFEDKEKIY